MNVPCILRGVVLCSVSMASAAVPVVDDSSALFPSHEVVTHIDEVLTGAAMPSQPYTKKEKEERVFRWRYIVCVAALCIGLYCWHQRAQEAGAPKKTVALALQNAPELAAWFEAGVRSQAVHAAAVPGVCEEFLHGVDRCARSSLVTLPPLVHSRGDVPVHFNNALIARFAQQEEIPSNKQGSSLLADREGVQADQCSIWRFCELVATHLHRVEEKEKAGGACADALLLLVARLRHNADLSAARAEITTWLQQQYPQRTRGYTPAGRIAILERLAKGAA